METPWLCCVAAWLATLVLFLFHRRRHGLNLPPGPKPWPFIGNLNLIGSLPHQSIHQLSKKYGPIMHLRFGSFPVVVGSSVEMAKLFLKTHDLTFVYRPGNAAGKYITYNYSYMTWSQYGPYWRQARKIFLIELFSPKRIDSYEYIRREERNSRWFGRRPTVRGVAMNPVDYPHGGGEGRSKSSEKHGKGSRTPWGKPTKSGYKT